VTQTHHNQTPSLRRRASRWAGMGRRALLPLIAVCTCTVFAQQDAPKPLPARCRAVVESKAKGGIRSRLAAVRALRDQTLIAAEVDALWAFFDETPEQASLPMRDLNHLRNDVLHTLVYHRPVLLDVPERLIATYRDQTQDRAWRDYCIQFLGQFYARASEDSKGDIREVLFEVAGKPGVPTAGTALIALTDNLASPEIDRETVVAAAVAIARESEASAGARMTAFQICARLVVREALPHARQAASGETTKSVTVRMSAVAALGTLGDESDRELLTKLSRSRDTRIRRAAIGGLRRLGQRNDGRPAR
jgi:hypothetical protein